MAISRRFPMEFDVAFPHGVFLISEVEPVIDFERSTRDNKVQMVDQDSGEPMWQATCLDADPEAKRAAKTVTVKIAAKVQPVPPANDGSSPFTSVVFEGLTALPWIEKVGEDFSRIAWSFRAQEMRAPSKATGTGSTSRLVWVVASFG